MTKRIKIIRIGLLSAIVIILITYFAIEVFEFHPSPPFAINNIKSTDLIYFDVAADNDQNINLVWTTRENIPTYQKSTDGGKTWSLYRNFDDLNSRMLIYPKILMVNNVLILLWTNEGSLFQRTSLDGGVSWKETKEVMARTVNDSTYVSGGFVYRYKNDEMAKTPRQLGAVLVSDGTINIVYGDINKQGLYFSKSDDYGDTWSEPKVLLSAIDWSFCTPSVASAISGENIHIVYRQAKPGKPDSTGLFYIHSPDRGEHWVSRGRIYTDRIILDSMNTLAGMRGNPQLAAIGDTLMLAILDDNLLRYLISGDNGNTWQPFEILRSVYSRTYSLYAQQNHGLLMLWIDHRNRAKDWWGYLTFHSMLHLFNVNPYWNNNDLYYALIKGNNTKTERLTPQLSYVEMRNPTKFNVIKCLPLGNKMIAFWAGKRKVGKNFTDQNIPYQIFYKPLTTD